MAQVPEACEMAIRVSELAKELEKALKDAHKERERAAERNKRDYEALREQLQGECAQVRKERDEAVAAGEKQRRALEERIDELERLLAAREQMLSSRDAEMHKAMIAMEALQQSVQQLTSDLRESTQQLREREIELAASRDEVVELKALVEQLRLNMEDLRNQLQFQREAEDVSSRQAKSDWLLKSLSARLEESRKALEDERAKLRVAEDTIASLKERVKELQMKVAARLCSVCSNQAREQIVKKPPADNEKPVGACMRACAMGVRRRCDVLAEYAGASAGVAGHVCMRVPASCGKGSKQAHAEAIGTRLGHGVEGWR